MFDNTNSYNCGSLGIISYNQRYLADDTDGDGTSDWDALYLQHDAAISDSACGGAVVNMKGEIIAMNALRINSTKIDNMAIRLFLKVGFYKEYRTDEIIMLKKEL